MAVLTNSSSGNLPNSLDNEHPVYVFELLCMPMRIPFRYHFSGNRKTNRIDKPEWIYNYVKEIIEQYIPFIVSVIQPIVDDCGLHDVDALNEFIRALLPLVKDKLLSSRQELITDENILSHLINETIKFDDYLISQYSFDTVESLEWLGITDFILSDMGLYQLWAKGEIAESESQFNQIISAKDTWVIDYDAVGKSKEAPTRAALRIRNVIEIVDQKHLQLLNIDFRLDLFIKCTLSLLDDFHSRLSSSLDSFELLSSAIIRNVPGIHREEARLIAGEKGLERLLRVHGSAIWILNSMDEWCDTIGYVELWEQVNTLALTGYFVGEYPHNKLNRILSSAIATTREDGTVFDRSMEKYLSLANRSKALMKSKFGREV